MKDITSQNSTTTSKCSAIKNCWKMKESRAAGHLAPTIRYHEGTYYLMATSKKGLGNFLCITNDLSKRRKSPHSGHDDWDRHVPILHQRRTQLLLLEVKGIRGAYIDSEDGKLLSPSLSSPRDSQATPQRHPIASRRDGNFYLIGAEGDTKYSHQECIAIRELIGILSEGGEATFSA